MQLVFALEFLAKSDPTSHTSRTLTDIRSELAFPLFLIIFTITRAVLAPCLLIALVKKTVAQWHEKMAIPRWVRVKCLFSVVFILAGSWFVCDYLPSNIDDHTRMFNCSHKSQFKHEERKHLAS